jgi:hypothetical protein
LNSIKLIYPYYENKSMLEMQRDNWNRYAGELRKHIEIIVIDDCSSTHPAERILKGMKIPTRLYRVTKRIPWNMHQCRNIGAHEACARGIDQWLFLSDIDIMLTAEMAYTLAEKKLDATKHYTFDRVFAPEFTVHKPHPNTFLVKHGLYWTINGYDLDLTPVGGGGYGGDGEFARQLRNISPVSELRDVVLVGYGRRERNGRAVLLDADTTDLDRDDWQKKYRARFDEKRKSGDMRSINPIRTPYERIPIA